jgi:thiosulfate dehydrogenase [quinone] large subunit
MTTMTAQQTRAVDEVSTGNTIWGLTRIALGLTFVWAFFDKLLALGFTTGRMEDGSIDLLGEAAWVSGGSPTYGFLNFGTTGPFAEFYQSIAGAAWADWLFMIGLLGIGVALTLGIGMKPTIRCTRLLRDFGP